MGESDFMIALRVVTTITAVLVCLAPLPDVLRVWRQQHTANMSVLPLVMIFSSSHIWAMYGYLVSNIFPLFVQCVIGEVANLGFLAVYYRLSTPDERRSVARLCAITAATLAVITLYVALATAGVTHESHREVEKVMGYIAVAINICMYGSPLEVMRAVIRAKSAAALPIAFSAISFLNCALWVVFGILDDDMFVLTPNAIATVLSAIQIGLYLKYPPHRGAVGTETQALVDLERSSSRDKDASVVVQVQVSPILDASPTATPYVPVASPSAGRA